MRKVKLISVLALALALYTAATVEPFERSLCRDCQSGGLELQDPCIVCARPRRCRARARSGTGSPGSTGLRERKSGSRLLGNRSRLLPRDHRRGDRQRHRRRSRTQIRVLNDTFGGGEGGADTGFSFELAGDHPHRQRRLVRDRDLRRRGRDEAGPQAGRQQRAERLLDERRRVPRLGLLPGHRHHQAGLPRWHRHRLAVDEGRLRRIRGHTTTRARR